MIKLELKRREPEIFILLVALAFTQTVAFEKVLRAFSELPKTPDYIIEIGSVFSSLCFFCYAIYLILLKIWNGSLLGRNKLSGEIRQVIVELITNGFAIIEVTFRAVFWGVTVSYLYKDYSELVFFGLSFIFFGKANLSSCAYRDKSF